MLRRTVNGQETRYWYKDESPVPCAMRTPCGDEFRYEYDEAYRLSVIASEFGERSFQRHRCLGQCIYGKL